MNRFYYLILIPILILFCSQSSFSQEFDFQAYKLNLEKVKDANHQTLSNLFPSGTFLNSVTKSTNKVSYLDSMKNSFSLTSQDIDQLNKNGFVVTNVNYKTIGSAYLSVFHEDLPIFISADAILHSLHFSYNNILTIMEEEILIDSVYYIVNQIKKQIPVLHAKYSSDSTILKSLTDLDLYLSVPLKILDTTAKSYYSVNDSVSSQLIRYINEYNPKDLTLFGDVLKTTDFSRFKPRSHYTQSERLSSYFKAMVWLSTTDISLTPTSLPMTNEVYLDLRRHIIMSKLLSESFHSAGVQTQYDSVIKLLKLLIGSADNTTVYNFDEVIADAKISGANALTDSLNIFKFLDVLKTKPFASQKILSQIVSDFGNEKEPKLTATIALFGSIFTVDSYILSQTVYPFVDCRDFPSTQDILFGIGNNSSLQFLDNNVSSYYPQIGKMRYLLDGQNKEYWNSSLYNIWLKSIRTMNPPLEKDRGSLPEFMQTAAWWQRMMNTQLGSWAQLRHDNLLYVKQSYSGELTCSFPHGYVDPYPALYQSINEYAGKASEIFDSLNTSSYKLNSIKNYYSYLKRYSAMLDTIAINELSGIPLTDNQIMFLQSTIADTKQDCGGNNLWSGWYPKLFISNEGVTPSNLNEGPGAQDYTIADIHTVPTDCQEIPIKAVMHVGVGPFKLMILKSKNTNGEEIAYAGPVFGYYEVTTKNNFLRLTDEDWTKILDNQLSTTVAPAFTYLYSTIGANRTDNISLKTNPTKINNNPIINESVFNLTCSPNPINSSGAAILSFRIPEEYSTKFYDISIYDELGKYVKQIDSGFSNTYASILKLALTTSNNSPLNSGIYYIKLQISDKTEIVKIVLSK